MTSTSEYCAPGHPDRVADGIVSYLLDRYIEKDPKTRFAVEAQVKDNHVTLGGEVTSAYAMPWLEIHRHVRDAICAIGYTPEYAKRWGAENCIDPDALDVVAHIGQQSPDIAQGVDDGGWGDQGIFWGMATGSELTGYMPLDHALAKGLGMWLYKAALDRSLTIGLDIKTQVTISDGRLEEVIVAAPTKEKDAEPIRMAILKWLWENQMLRLRDKSIDLTPCNLIFNGTGAYVRHASAGDCGTTGRKLAVDFYGGNCRIGGGSPWSKDATKADVTLNVYARERALRMLKETNYGTVYCAISCCIGKRDIRLSFFDGNMRQIASETEARPASEIIAELGLDRPVFAYRCRNGLFAEPGDAKP